MIGCFEKNGRAFLMYAAAGYADGNPEVIRTLIQDPITVMGGSDAGAHVRQIIDAGVPTYALTHWTRDKAADDPSRLPLEFIVKKLTHDSAGCLAFATGVRLKLVPRQT